MIWYIKRKIQKPKMAQKCLLLTKACLKLKSTNVSLALDLYLQNSQLNYNFRRWIKDEGNYYWLWGGEGWQALQAKFSKINWVKGIFMNCMHWKNFLTQKEARNGQEESVNSFVYTLKEIQSSYCGF